MASPDRRRTPRPTGLPVLGTEAIDPTENVKDLMEASNKALTREGELQALIQDEKIKRVDREWQHQETMAVLRAEHAKETRIYDNERLDKIRTVDVANAAATAAQILTAVNNYAAAQERTAQTLRDQVASTADASLKSQAALINPIVDRVAALEKSSYTGAGKEQVADPRVERMAMMVESLVSAQAKNAGKDSVTDPQLVSVLNNMSLILGKLDKGDGRQQGMSDSAKMIVFGLSVVTALMGFYTFSQRPPVAYTPAPAGYMLPTAPTTPAPR